MFLLRKLIRLLQVKVMVKEYDRLIQQKHMYTERVKIQSVKKKEIKCNKVIKQCKNG